jgi:hypothetical protein
MRFWAASKKERARVKLGEVRASMEEEPWRSLKDSAMEPRAQMRS